MGIVKRCARLFEADLHGILDFLEDPEALLTHSLREMETMIAQEEEKIKERERIQECFMKREEKLLSERKELQENVTFCIAHHDDALAKIALRKRMEVDSVIREVSSQREINERELIESKKTHERNREALRLLKEKIACAEERRRCIVEEPLHFKSEISEGDLEVALLSEKARSMKEAQ